jgi:glycosyltransferase involved in cell wall biosynthesis
VGERDARPRLLIFVIAYHADATLAAVLARIPRSVFDDYECRVLVVDDASEDRTFEIGCDYRDTNPGVPLVVLRNEYNQGYGGNQKVGYTYAENEGFDLVAMVHGDGQYAPEALPALLEPFRRGAADAVFGSRMMTRLGALKGGMPLYKYVGNRILTTLQNALLGTRLSEFHSGYRIYAVATLRRIPYRLNSNDFHFDTEIIIQLFNAGARIVELPIPTYYGDEICRVNGLRYAKDVLLATVQNVFHRAGLLYQRRFDTSAEGNTHYDVKLGYASSHTFALQAVPDGARVVDVGSGPGDIARELRRRGCDVAVVDQFVPGPATPDGIRVYQQDLNDEPRFPVRDFDYVLLLDILEHLYSPELFLRRLRAQLDHRARTFVISTPNVAFCVVRLMLLLGQFNYGKSGILDRTHTRLFTFRSLCRLLEEEGFRIRRVRGVPAPFPKVLGRGWAGRLAVALNLALIRVSKSLFAYQVFVVAESTPDVDFVLADTRRMSERRREGSASATPAAAAAQRVDASASR